MDETGWRNMAILALTFLRMITIFTSARPFSNPHINLIQRNAIASWKKLRPSCEIIIVGDEEGIAQVAREFDLIHISNVEKNAEGKPLKNAVFREAIKKASHKLVCFVNADILLLNDLLEAVKRIPLANFLLAGRRWDVDIKKPIPFSHPQYEMALRNKVKKEGNLHGPAALDYVVFPKHVDLAMPPFAMNRGGWDNWIIYRFKSLRIPVIDATAAVTSVHQNHPMHLIKNLWRENPLARNELALAGGFSSFLTLREADLLLTPYGLEKPPFPRKALAYLAFYKPWRLLLALKRWAQQYLS